MARGVSILIKNGLLVTQDQSRRVLEGNLYVEGDKIVEVAGPDRSADSVIDASGCLVLPGLVNGYTRVAHTLLGPPKDLSPESAHRKMEALRERLTRRDVQMAAALAAAQMLQSGTTSFLDLFTWEDEVSRAVAHVGMRGFLAWDVGEAAEDLDACEQYLSRFKSRERIVPLVGTGNLSQAEAVRDLARKYGTRWCVPLSETRTAVYRFQRETGARPVEWLAKGQLLSADLIALHCIWLTLNEIRSLSRAEVKVIHCPASNQMTGAGGPMPLQEMLHEGLAVGIGTDSPFLCGTLDPFHHMRLCGSLHKGNRWDAAAVPAQLILDLFTVRSSECLGLDGGSLEEGRVADVVVLDPQRRISLPTGPEEIISYLVYVAEGAQVRHVVVSGTHVVEDAALRTVDIEVLREDVGRMRAELGHEDSWR